MTNRWLLAPMLVVLGGSLSGAMAATEERQVSWEGLTAVLNQHVRMVMPDGVRIEGHAVQLESDALAVAIEKTSNQAAYPKGRFLVARAKLKAIDVIERSTVRWRIIGVGLSCGVAYVAARAAANMAKSSTAGGLGFGAAAAGVPVLGYLLGRSADRQVITYVITP